MTERKLVRQPVEGGALSDLTSILKRFFDTLFKGIDTFLDNLGYAKGDCKDVEEHGKKGKQTVYDSGSGEKVVVTVFPEDEKGMKVTVKISHNGKNEKIYEHLSQAAVEKKISEYMEDNDLGSNEGPVENAKQIICTLRKVTGSGDIELVAIEANYAIKEAVRNLTEILDDENCVAAIPEGDTTYQISTTDNSDEYDMNECNECVDINACIASIYYAALNAEMVCRWAITSISGPEAVNYKNVIENIKWTCSYTGDNAAIAHKIELNSALTPVLTLPKLPESPTLAEVVAIVKEHVGTVVDLIDCYYCNLPANLQNQFSNSLNDLQNGIKIGLTPMPTV